ncbi:MAG: OsmC family protein [Candidatus Limnocylindria bacterium]
MPAEQIRSAIEDAIGYLTVHPEEAAYTDSVAVALLGDNLHCRVEGPAGETLDTDMPASIGGSGAAPSPGWFLRAAMASCVASLIAMRAAMEEIQLSTVEVSVESDSDDRGILGLSDGVPAGPLASRVLVRLAASGADADELRSVAEWAVEHCPVTDAVSRAVPLTTAVELA